MKRYKIGVVGLNFGKQFSNLINAHPLVEECVLCDLREEKIKEAAEEFGIKGRTASSFDELLKMDVDGVAIFTQRWTHARMAIDALKAGKHVYSAVPAGVTVEELEELVKTVEETGLTYALGETSFYRPQTIWCRQKWAEGAFGRFVYGEGNYYHNMAHWFYRPFYDANGPDWKKYASVPPMWYISHSASHILGVTFGKFTKVSCLGWSDDHPDGIFDRSVSAFDNDFSNQTALLRTGDGGMARINEFRRTAAGECRQMIVGTDAAYQEQTNPQTYEMSVEQEMKGEAHDKKNVPRNHAVWTEERWKESPFRDDGTFDHVNAEHWSIRYKEDVSWIHEHESDGVLITEENLGNLPREFLGRRHGVQNKLLPVERIPEEFVGLPSAHGSGQLLIQDFLEAIDTGKLPPNHVWISARYSVAGAVAHESSKREGEMLPVPDFGVPPRDKECIDPLVKLQE